MTEFHGSVQGVNVIVRSYDNVIYEAIVGEKKAKVRQDGDHNWIYDSTENGFNYIDPEKIGELIESYHLNN